MKAHTRQHSVKAYLGRIGQKLPWIIRINYVQNSCEIPTPY